MTHGLVFPIFVCTWIILGIISFIVFFIGKNAQLKRKLWPPFVIGSGILFISFTYAMGFRGEGIYFVVPVVMLVSFINIRSIKFCDECGKTIKSQNLLSKIEFCPKCGAKLKQDI
jgi:hypothetical protein